MTIQLKDGFQPIRIRVNSKTAEYEYTLILKSLFNQETFEFSVIDFMPHSNQVVSVIDIPTTIESGDYQYTLKRGSEIVREGLALKYTI